MMNRNEKVLNKIHTSPLRVGVALGFLLCTACGGAAQAQNLAGGGRSQGSSQGSFEDEVALIQPWESFGPTSGNKNIELVAARNYTTDALIFDGVGTSDDDARALAQIMTEHGKTYRIVDSNELNAMSLDEMTQYGVILWPGGYAGQMTSSLDPQTRERVREAVNLKGVGYVGFCAGAFMAVSPAPAPGGTPDWGLSLISGEILPYYYLEDQGVEYSMVQVSFPGSASPSSNPSVGAKRDLVWWGGPTFPASSQGAVSRYTNGEAAIVEGWAGKGFVVLSAPHPEAPQSWRDTLGLTDSDGMDWDVAWNLIQAALDRKPLPTFVR